MRRAVLAVAVLLTLAGCGSGASASTDAAATTSVQWETSAPDLPTSMPPLPPEPSGEIIAPAPSTPPTVQAPVAATSADPVPAGLSCADVGGVFVSHGTDGRGDCEPADPRRSCHVPPAQQPENYLADLTMTPPFPNGSIDYPILIGMASNADCWKQP